MKDTPVHPNDVVRELCSSNEAATPASGPAPWERLPGEPWRWFNRFEQYRLMGPTRSVLRVYRAERAARAPIKPSQALSSPLKPSGAQPQTQPIPVPAAVPPVWRRAAVHWRWRERAEAWDAQVLAAARAAEEETRRRMRAEQLAALTEVQGRLRQALAEFDPERNPPSLRELAAVLRAVGEEMRALFDEAPKQRHELAGPEGEPLLPLDLLAELAERALRSAEVAGDGDDDGDGNSDDDG